MKGPARIHLAENRFAQALAAALQQEGVCRWRLSGQSMAPTLPDGAWLMIEAVDLPAQPPRPGQILLFALGTELLVHRLVARKRDRQENVKWITQGDGLSQPDLPLGSAQIVGRVTAAHVDDNLIWPKPLSDVAGMGWVGRYHLLRLRRRLLAQGIFWRHDGKASS